MTVGDEVLVFMVREVLVYSMKISAPILGAGLVVGLVISLLQSVTSIQDQTLSFVPKFVVMLAVAAALLPWVAMRLIEYTTEMLRLF